MLSRSSFGKMKAVAGVAGSDMAEITSAKCSAVLLELRG
jgi:hypothetical protein